MAISYRRPGVYTRETLLPLTEGSPTGAGRAVAAFVGTSLAGGPVGPTRVNSWLDFYERFGGFGAGSDMLPFAVYSFFNNGGSTALISRAISSGATASSVDLASAADAEVDVLRVTAISPGTWGDTVSITTKTNADATFDLSVVVGTAVRERFPSLSLGTTSPTFVESVINSPVNGSRIVQVTVANTVDATVLPAEGTRVALEGGGEGTGAPDLVAASVALADVDAVLNVNLPGVSTGAPLNEVIAWAASTGRVFLVVDVPRTAPGTSSVAGATVAQSMLSGAQSVTPSTFAAVYGPWLAFQDPLSTVPGATRVLPPGGAVLGQYAATDTARGAVKAAAGINNVIAGAVAPTVVFADAELETLNEAGVNVIRTMPGRGICIMGARTLAKGTPDRYVSVRRVLMEIAHALSVSSRFALFEPNDDALWARLKATTTQYLLAQFGSGVLRGTSPEQAFFVKCDAENNPSTSASAGVVNMTVGLALTSSAEFVVIDITQITGSADN